MPFLIVLILLIIAGVYAERQIQLRQRVAPRLHAVRDQFSSVTDQVFENVRSITESGFNSKTTEILAQNFIEWVKVGLNDEPELQLWLLSLSPEGSRALAYQLALFCNDLNIELRWLNDHDLSQNPELESPIKAVVVMYCKACWKATQIQPELNQFRTYMDTLNSLARKENDEVGMQLLNKLADLKLIEPPTPEILLGTERERREYVDASIRKAARTDRKAFDQVLEDVINT
ncbi:MAG: hypothetical protein ACOYLB_12185 [Phototrophicaceae bacterium]